VRILLDECVPARLARDLAGHEVRSVAAMEWAGKSNDDLLALAGREFDVCLTVDRNRSIQQAVGRYELAVIVMVASSHRLHDLRSLVDEVLAVCRYTRPGQVVKVG
jgi:hypothetical protein